MVGAIWVYVWKFKKYRFFALADPVLEIYVTGVGLKKVFTA